MQYCIAAALADGEVTIRHFENENEVLRDDLQQLLAKAEYVHPPEREAELAPKGEVAIALRNGQTYAHRVDFSRGEPENPLTWEEVSSKYRDCAGAALDSRGVEQTLQIVSNLESLEDVTRLMDHLRG